MRFELTPIDLLFQQMDSLDDASILKMGQKIDWQTPQTQLLRWDKERRADIKFILPIECLIRSGSTRVKELLILQNIDALKKEMPFIQTQSIEIPNNFKIAFETAIKMLDIPSIQTLIHHLPPKYNEFSHFLSIQNNELPIFQFGHFQNPTQNQEKILLLFQEIESFFPPYQKNSFVWSMWKSIRSPQKKKAQMMDDLKSVFLNKAILSQKTDWAEYWLNHTSASINHLTLELLLDERFLFLVPNALKKIREQDFTHSNFNWIFQLTYNNSNSRYSFNKPEKNQSSQFSIVLFKKVEHFSYEIKQLLEQQNRTNQNEDDEQNNHWLEQVIYQKRLFLNNFVFLVLEDEFAFLDFKGISKPDWIAQTYDHILPEHLNKWLTLIEQKQIPLLEEEIGMLFSSKKFDILQTRMDQTTTLGLKHADFLSVLAKTKKSFFDEESLQYLSSIWNQAQQLSVKPWTVDEFMKSIKLNENHKTYFLLQLQTKTLPNPKTKVVTRI